MKSKVNVPGYLLFSNGLYVNGKNLRVELGFGDLYRKI